MTVQTETFPAVPAHLPAPARSAGPAPDPAPAASTPVPAGETPRVRRDLWVDLLGTLALVRIVSYSSLGWAWLPFVFPSMAVLFALAGSLVATSLDRAGHDPWRVLARRTRRLLPPLWVLGLVLVPLMLARDGWAVGDGGGVPLDARALLYWLVPLGEPGASDWGHQLTTSLWYVRAYLWFLLLSPSFLWMFRRWPKRVLALPLGMVLLAAAGVLDLTAGTGSTRTALATMATFGACWLVGFAYSDGMLRRLPARAALALGAVSLLLGTYWAATRAQWELGGGVLGEALYSLGFVLLLLRFPPSLGWLARRGWLTALVGAFSSRAMTVYLWGNVAIVLAAALLGGDAPVLGQPALAALARYLLAWTLVVAAVLAFGWVEDLAAARPLRITPWPRSSGVEDLSLTDQRSSLLEQRTAAASGQPAADRGRPRLGALPRRPLAGAAGMLVLAGALALAWATGDREGITPTPATGDVPGVGAVRDSVQPQAAAEAAGREVGRGYGSLGSAAGQRDAAGSPAGDSAAGGGGMLALLPFGLGELLTDESAGTGGTPATVPASGNPTPGGTPTAGGGQEPAAGSTSGTGATPDRGTAPGSSATPGPSATSTPSTSSSPSATSDPGTPSTPDATSGPGTPAASPDAGSAADPDPVGAPEPAGSPGTPAGAPQGQAPDDPAPAAGGEAAPGAESPAAPAEPATVAGEAPAEPAG